METMLVEGLNVRSVLLAIGNLRALLSRASEDDRVIALKFLYWSDKGPVFECDAASRPVLERLRTNPPKHSDFGSYQI